MGHTLRTCSSYKNSGHTMSSTQHGLTEWSLWQRHSSLFWPLLLYWVHNSILLLGLQARTSFMACPILNSFRILSSEIFWHHVIEYFDLSVYSLIFNILPTSFIKHLLIRTLCHSPYVVYIWEYFIKLPLKYVNHIWDQMLEWLPLKYVNHI